MTRCYKLTNQQMQTHGDYQWVLGEWHATSGAGALCGPGWLHCYETALLAVLRNPADANIQRPRLFECECEGAEKIEALKRGYTRMRLLREIPLPKLTTGQRVIFAIHCAVCAGASDDAWLAWATHYVSGDDRSRESAHAAAAAANAAWAAAAAAAAWAAANAAYADANAANAAYAAAYADANAIPFAQLAEEATK